MRIRGAGFGLGGVDKGRFALYDRGRESVTTE